MKLKKLKIKTQYDFHKYEHHAIHHAKHPVLIPLLWRTVTTTMHKTQYCMEYQGTYRMNAGSKSGVICHHGPKPGA